MSDTSMQPTPPNPQQLRAFLLGLDNGHVLEDSLFTDSSSASELQLELEQEQQALIDDFLSGLLSGRERRIFSRQIERSPDLAQRVSQHRILRATLTRSAQPARPLKPRAPLFRLPLFGFSLAFVALCIFYVFASRQRHAPAAPATPSPTQQARAAIPPVKDALIAQTFFLTDAVTRGTPNVPALHIKPGIGQLDLQLEIRDAGAGSEWNVAAFQGTTRVWCCTTERIQKVGTQPVLTVKIPAEPFTRGTYSVTATPTLRASSGIAERTFAFRVAR